MRILGIDPGVATVGFGVIESERGQQQMLQYGAITTAAGLPLATRLVQIADDMEELIRRFHPDEIAIEELFFNKNITTGITVGQARGVLLLSCAQKGLQVHEYTPLQVKQALVGNGRAEKQQVQFMVKTFLGLREVPKPDDAADALAIAICHTHHHQTRTRSTQR